MDPPCTSTVDAGSERIVNIQSLPAMALQLQLSKLAGQFATRHSSATSWINALTERSTSLMQKKRSWQICEGCQMHRVVLPLICCHFSTRMRWNCVPACVQKQSLLLSYMPAPWRCSWPLVPLLSHQSEHLLSAPHHSLSLTCTSC